MFVFGDRVVCDTADLIRAARCEFALLRALDAELGNIEPQAVQHRADADVTRPDEPAPFPGTAGGALSGAGYEHMLSGFLDTFGARVAQVGGPGAPSYPLAAGVGAGERPADIVARLDGAHTETLAALQDSAPVIAGVTFFDGRFVARADFLVRVEHRIRYRVHGGTSDDRYAVAAAVELAGAGRALETAGVPADPLVSLRVGHGQQGQRCGRVFELDDLLPVFRARRARLERIVEEKLNELLPVQWGDPRYLACAHCPTCTRAAAEARDLLLVAGMDATTRARLREAGITSIDRLAAGSDAVAAVSSRVVRRLGEQAGIQLRRERSGKPELEIVDPTALAALPPPTPGDLSLTIEPIAPRRVRIALGGRGSVQLQRDIPVEPNPQAAVPRDIREAQRRVLDEVLAFVTSRQRTHPGLRVFHYTPAVRSALLTASARLGAGEETVDELLRAGVLVDLYPIVRSAIRIGEETYALERIRRILSSPGHADDEPPCLTVLRLRDRLLDAATERRLSAPHPSAQPAPHHTQPGPPPRPTSVEAALAEYAESRPEMQRVAALTAAAAGYHRRERQLRWWAHADRLRYPVEDWPDAPGLMVADNAVLDTKWHLSPRGDSVRRFLTLTGRIATGGPLPPGAPVYVYYDRPAGAAGRAVALATVLGCSVDANFDDTVRLEERLDPGREPYNDLPVALAPGLPERDESVETAVEYAAGQLLMTLPNLPEQAVFDVLALRAPRLRSLDELPKVHGDHAAAIATAVHDLDASYLAVQGPTGTGKTATIARVIERVVTRDGWRVGVVATTAGAVENLLDAVVRIGVLPQLIAKRDAAAVAPEWSVIEAGRYRSFLAHAINGCVLGGSPADFADERLVPRGALDLLVIADAGRFALADTVAVAVSARNLLVVGDPVPPPPNHRNPAMSAEGPHPEPVGGSVLGWLTAGRATLPTSRGYFLDRTWRMHPTVSAPISRCYYEGRLRASETVTLARHLAGVEPGIGTVLVEHHGNSTESEEEAREVVRQVKALLGLPWTIGATTRRLHPHDIVVVTPYRAQVARIRTLLARARVDDVLVGTPELFRSREAAVVLLSLATSSPVDAPYGMSFLVSRALVQGAVGRAMWKAIIIRSPLLTEYLPGTPEKLSELARFLRLD